ncbi:MAG: helix-turn-helix domain-containing protein [Eubacterium sp.]
MTFERLYQLRIIKKQIELFETPKAYIAAVDTSKPAVMSYSATDTVADTAIKSVELQQEYERLVNEYTELMKYILHIKDEFVKAIAIRKFIVGQSYSEIARELYCDKSTVCRTLKKYIKKNP